MLEKPKNLPLDGLRVLELCDRVGQSCGRLLADLGAEVILIEPTGGMASRSRAPLHHGNSLYFSVHNANKKSIELDFSDKNSRELLVDLAKSSDFLLCGSEIKQLEAIELGIKELRNANPQLLILSITDFGLQGPYKDFVATEAVHSAMGAVLARSGRDGREPLLPPGEMASETASIQACWVALLAYWQRSHNGCGDLLDFSINDAVAQVLDPGVGAAGSAAAGRTPVEVAEHGRPLVKREHGKLPPLGLLYPVFKCADGHVRLCVLNPRQWEGMSAWLGTDHPYIHPKYAKTANRLLDITAINSLIGKLFVNKKKMDLVSEGKQRGIPIAAIASPSDLWDKQHYAQREFFTDLTVGDAHGKLPAGYYRIDNKRVGIYSAAPKLGGDTKELLSDTRPKSIPPSKGKNNNRPLEDIVVLDLGVIVAGGELGRLFSDQGATVIKVENKAYADGLRTSMDGNPVPISFAQGSRGKKSVGINLRSPKGIEIFKALAATSDVIISNFKPGTMESLGIGFDVLKAINPRIICAESSAMGSQGSESKTMGYGPLVRASTALSSLWRYPDDDEGFGDSVTIFPDHFCARVSAVAIMAKLIERKKTGVGGFIDISQAETIMNVLSTEFMRESLEPGTMVAKGNRNEFDAPNSLFRCNGNDEWCVISVTNDKQWQGLCRAMNRQDLSNNPLYSSAEGRLAHKEVLERELSSWTENIDPIKVMNTCQSEGVPAGNMLRLSAFLSNPQYQARGFFRTLNQPTVGRPIPTENAPVAFSETLPQPEIVRAPARAEHTREVLKEHLGYSDQLIDDLVSNGDLELGQPGTHGVNRQKLKTLLVSIAASALLKYHALKARGAD